MTTPPTPSPLWLHLHDTHDLILVETELEDIRRLAAADKQRECDEVRDQLARMQAERTAWEDSAAQFHRNSEFYRGLISGIGSQFGIAACTSDDGSIQEDILALKVPELVIALQAQRDAACAYAWRLREELSNIANGDPSDSFEEWSKSRARHALALTPPDALAAQQATP